MVTIKKSPGFDKPFDVKVLTKQIDENIEEIADIAATVANHIAPIESGDLRGSMKKTNRYLKKTIKWAVFNRNFEYASYRYDNNDKNPQTKEWAQKAHERNSGRFLKIAGRKLNI